MWKRFGALMGIVALSAGSAAAQGLEIGNITTNTATINSVVTNTASGGTATAITEITNVINNEAVDTPNGAVAVTSSPMMQSHAVDSTHTLINGITGGTPGGGNANFQPFLDLAFQLNENRPADLNGALGLAEQLGVEVGGLFDEGPEELSGLFGQNGPLPN